VSGKIVSVGEDLFFWSQIHDAAQRAGRVAIRVSDEAGMDAAWKAGGVFLLLADLSARSVDVLAWAPKWKRSDPAPTLVSYAAHVDAATHERARSAGFDVVLPKSKFHAVLTRILSAPEGGNEGTPRDG
jgi:hypothetical protein